MKDGIHSVAFEDYTAADGVSKSMLDQLAWPKTPAHLKAYLERKPEATDSQRFGALLHRCLLEPDTVSELAVRPEGMKFSTKEGIAWKAENAGRDIVTREEKSQIDAMCGNLWKHPRAKLLLGHDKERSLWATDGHGTLRKGRMDLLPITGNVVADVKTTAEACVSEFERSIYNYRYHVQGAYYIDLCNLLGMDKREFVLICVEKTAPYLVAVYAIEPDVLEYGRKMYQRDLTLYRSCVEKDQWPGYDENILRIGIPEWARKEMEKIV
jgi:exodeoxyribonuclease VIII